jgi:hypothetical protein
MTNNINKELGKQQAWLKEINEQIGRYFLECGQCESRPMTDSERIKYAKKI